MTQQHANRLLVPVGDSVTVRSTVAYVVDQAEQALGDGERVELHFAAIRASRVDETGESTEELELLDRVRLWVEEDFGDEQPDGVTVETTVLGEDQYLFSPSDYAEVILEHAAAHDIDRIVLDPEYNPVGTTPLLQPLEVELARSDLEIEQAPVERPTRTTSISRATSIYKYVAVFLSAFGFYIALGSLTTFDLLTAGVSAGVVATVLAPVVTRGDPSLVRGVTQLLRLVPYSLYLLWEIAKANLAIAYVVLHPSLPIDPKMVEVESAVWGDLPITALANSITLTPGTLSVSVSKRRFRIHSLTASAREGLFDGGLERAVRFVFYGRSAARIASPRERGDVSEIADDGSEVADDD